jgi:uncharacterized protein (DUF2267 family)
VRVALLRPANDVPTCLSAEFLAFQADGRQVASDQAMTRAALELFDVTVQKTNAWLKELMQELNWADRRRTFVAFRAVLHAIRDHLRPEDAVRLADQLPTLIRGYYFEHWNVAAGPNGFQAKEQLSSLGEDVDSDKIIRAVFRLFERKVTEGEIEDITGLLPTDLQEFWPPHKRAA